MNTLFFCQEIWAADYLRQHRAAILKSYTVLFMHLSDKNPHPVGVTELTRTHTSIFDKSHTATYWWVKCCHHILGKAGTQKMLPLQIICVGARAASNHYTSIIIFILIFLKYPQTDRQTDRFLKDRVTLTNGVMKIQLCHQRNTFIWICIKIENHYFFKFE